MAIMLGGCSLLRTAPIVGQPLVDRVVDREGPWSSCVTYSPRDHVAKADSDGPPGILTPLSFEDPDARKAASAIAIDWSDMQDSDPVTLGEADGEWCPMSVSGPAISGDYAFLSFSEPGGELGAYAFKRAGDGWRIVEKVHLGWW